MRSGLLGVDPDCCGGNHWPEAETEADARENRRTQNVNSESAAGADQAEPREPGCGEQPTADQEDPGRKAFQFPRYGAGDHPKCEAGTQRRLERVQSRALVGGRET